MRSVPGAVLLLCLLLTLSCGTPGSRQSQSTILVDGSSTVYPITEAMAEEFRSSHPEVRVTIGISGTGGGFKKFCRNETDISDASRPIKSSELELARKNQVDFIELPVAYDGIAVVVNPANDWCQSLTVAELGKLWKPEAQGKVVRWNQVRTGWPDREIHLFGPGVDSGTYDYFTQAVNGREGASRGDFTSSEDDNVLVQGVASDPLALGFFGYAYYRENRKRLKIVPIDDQVAADGAGAIVPSMETVAGGTYQPLSRPIFIYVKRSAAGRAEVQAFVEFYLAQAPHLIPQVGYIPLPERAYHLALERFHKRVTGSVFGGGGSHVGVSIEELLEADARGLE